jgi:hypothetical protein
MSADLFAAFNDDSTSSQQASKQQSANKLPATSDPFAFFASNTPSNQPPSSQPQSQWPSFQAQQPNNNSQAWPSSKAQTAGDLWGDLTGLGRSSSTVQKEEEDEDAWGDFEVAPQGTNNTSVPSYQDPKPSSITASAPQRPKTRIMRAPTIELMTNRLVDIGGLGGSEDSFHQRPSWAAPKKTIPSQPKKPDPNVLFDADDFDGQPPEDDDDDDDGFGDFETVANPPRASPMPSADLISTHSTPKKSGASNVPPSQILSTLTIDEPTSLYPAAPKSPSFQERNPFPGLEVTTPVASTFPKDSLFSVDSPATAWPDLDTKAKGGKATEVNAFEDEWGSFGATTSGMKVNQSTQVAPSTKANPAAKAEADWGWEAWEATETTKPAQVVPVSNSTVKTEEAGPPPTNVPPPAILLSLFPQLLTSVDTSLFKPTNGQSAPVKDQVLSDPATMRFLRGYLSLACVAGRVMAGRKQRWHRDRFLSQGMAISAAGGKRGMKLSGIDRTQSGHEDREAADVVGAWKELVGRLRSAVATANAAASRRGEPLLRIPELAEAMPVTTAKGVPTAPKPCVICGLKREERVGKIDFEVEDSFGEWWVEFWGHRACRNFWLEHEVKLRQR